MPLQKTLLADTFEQIFASKPASSEDSALVQARAYVDYASGALSSSGSLPTTATANLAILFPAFRAALDAKAAPAAAAAIAGGVMAFWQAMVWVGPGFVGVTAFPGNASLLGTLLGILLDLGAKSDADKARELADAFDAGARTVMVVDTHVATGQTVAGPIQ